MMSNSKYLLSNGINTLVKQRSDSMRERLYSLMARNTFVAVDPTFQDLNSTGNLRLIGNAELRRQVIIYYQDLEKLEAIMRQNTLT